MATITGQRTNDNSAAENSGSRARAVVVIGTSAGGVEALQTLVRSLSPDLPAAILVVLHLPPTGKSVLPQILARQGTLRVEEIRSGDPLLQGSLYVAMPDHHLLVRDSRVFVSRGPRENRCRPAIDPLFRSAARYYENRVVGIILTGNLDDGTAGIQAVKEAGGVTIVQDPEEAAFPGMPRSALESVEVDHVMPLASMPDLITSCVQEMAASAPKHGRVEEFDSWDLEESIVNGELEKEPLPAGDSREPSIYTCPECHGSMIEVRDGDVVFFKCHVGHTFSPETLVDGQAEAIEQALWTALAALEESTNLTKRLADRSRDRGHLSTAERFDTRAQKTAEQAEVLRRLLYIKKDAPGEEEAG